MKLKVIYFLIFLNIFHIDTFIIISDKELKSFRPVIEVVKLDNQKNEQINTKSTNLENELLKNKIKELQQEILHLKKCMNHIKIQVNIML